MKDVISVSKNNGEISPHSEQLAEWQTSLYSSSSESLLVGESDSDSRRPLLDGKSIEEHGSGSNESLLRSFLNEAQGPGPDSHQLSLDDREFEIVDKSDAMHSEEFPSPLQQRMDMYGGNKIGRIIETNRSTLYKLVHGVFADPSKAIGDANERYYLHDMRSQAAVEETSNIYTDKNLSMHEQVSADVNCKYEAQKTNLVQEIEKFETPYKEWAITDKFPDLATGTKEENVAKADRYLELIKMKKGELKTLEETITSEINTIYKAQTDLQIKAQEARLETQINGHNYQLNRLKGNKWTVKPVLRANMGSLLP